MKHWGGEEEEGSYACGGGGARRRRVVWGATCVCMAVACVREFVIWLSQLSLPATWANGQDLAHPQTWRYPNLIALNTTHARLLQDFQCVERNLQDADADAPLADNALPTTTLSIPPLNLLASMRDFCSRHHVQAQWLHHPTQECHFQPRLQNGRLRDSRYQPRRELRLGN